MMSFNQIRNERLSQLSQMVINGEITYKLDHIATVYINGRHYFNVFRRYNSPYNIVIEDMHSDFYLHQDYTVRKSLQTVLCLPEWEAGNIYTWNATSYKHNGPPPSLSTDLADMRWTDIQAAYQAVSVNFGGIFYNEVAPSTPLSQIMKEPVMPGAPARPLPPMQLTPQHQPVQPISDAEAANILLSISVPVVEEPFILRESDGPTLSMRFADVENRLKSEHVSCYCKMDSDEDLDSESDDESNFTVLRSGTMIPKSS